MSDNLTTRLTAIQTQLAEQHAALMTRLDILDDMEENIASISAAIADNLDDIASATSGILANLEPLSVNMTNGFRDVNANLAALYCPCDVNAPLLPGKPSTTPTEATQSALCQRIQYFIDLYRLGVVVNACAYVFDAGIMSGISANQIQAAALQAVDISTGDIAQGMPQSTQSGVASAWNQYIAAVGAPVAQGNVFEIANDLDQWSGIRDALSGANSASEAFPGLVNAIAAADWEPGVAAILSSGFYTAWLNDIYSDVPIIDASEYDGSVCSFIPAACLVLDSNASTSDGGFNGWAITSGLPNGHYFATIGTSSGDRTFTPPVFVDNDYFDWTIRLISGAAVVQWRPAGIESGDLYTVDDLSGELYTCHHSGTFGIVSFSGEFSIRMCPPGVDNPPIES